MALPAVGLVAKGLLGSLKGEKKETPQVTPVTAKVPVVTKPKETEETADTVSKKPTTAPKAPKTSISSPLFSKTGMDSIDSALQNVSKSLGGIKQTIYSQAEFDKKKREQAKKAQTQAKRKKVERESEKGGVGGPAGKLLSSIAKPTKSFLGGLFKFLINIILGSLTAFVLQNIEVIKKTIEDVVTTVQDLFAELNKWVIEPIFNMVKAVAGPINKAINAIIPDIPDFTKENKNIEDELGNLETEKNSFLDMIPGVKDAIKGIENLIKHGDPSIGKEEFDQQVAERDTTQPDQAKPPSQRTGPNQGTGRDGGFGTGTTGEGRPTDGQPTPPATAGSSGLSPNAKALLDTIAYAEGTSGPKGYVTWFGGRTDMDVTKMTINDVVKEQKRRLANGEATYGQYTSAAVGRYQMMEPEVFAKKAGLDPSKDYFTPANQDKMAIAGYMKGQAKLTDAEINGPISRQLIAKIAPVWASLPKLNGASAYGQPVKRYETLVKIYEQKLKEAQQSQRSQSIQRTQPTPPSLRTGQLTDLVSRQGLDKLYGAPTGPVRTSNRGMRNGRHHAGIDFGTGGQKGWFCSFRMKGTVSFVGSLSGYGKTVIINSGGYDFLFAHLASYNVRQGEAYNGQIIGEIGNTGVGSGEHLHFEVRTKGGANGSDVDPNPYVKYLDIGRMGDPTTDRRVTTPEIRQLPKVRGTGINRNTSYNGNTTRTVIMPVTSPSNQMPASGASGMMSYAGGGRGRIDNNKSSINNKLYRQ